MLESSRSRRGRIAQNDGNHHAQQRCPFVRVAMRPRDWKGCLEHWHAAHGGRERAMCQALEASGDNTDFVSHCEVALYSHEMSTCWYD
jgi:hypothetical protein